MRIKHGIIACGLAFTLGFAAPAFAAEQAEAPAPAVTCHNGSFTGVKLDNGVYAYLGIPFAKPPIGPLRWKAPVDVEDCQGNFKAVHFGKRPMQLEVPGDEEPHGDSPLGEDCLCLNVWTADPNIKGKPVMVYFHGGAFGWESTADDIYDLRYMAAENPDIVFVSAEYRVNALGYIDLTRVPDGKVYKAADFKDSMQLGLMDNISALRWVNRNIEAFGGDKGNVTIFGESAGGGISSMLMIAKEAKGLFQRAIPMSGAANLNITKQQYERMDQAGALMEATGCKNMDDLMALTEEQILEAFKQPTERVGLENVGGVDHLNGEPVRGMGGLVPDNPMKAIEEGAGADIDMMIGTVADEWRYWMPEMERPSKEENLKAYYEFMELIADRISGSGLITKHDPQIDVKGFMDVVQTIAATNHAGHVYLALYHDSDFSVGDTSISVSGNYPIRDSVKVLVRAKRETVLSLRVPRWCGRMTVNGTPVGEDDSAGGWTRISVPAGESVCSLGFHMSARIVPIPPERGGDFPDAKSRKTALHAWSRVSGEDDIVRAFRHSPALQVMRGPLLLAKSIKLGGPEGSVFESALKDGDGWKVVAVEQAAESVWGRWILEFRNGQRTHSVDACDYSSAATWDGRGLEFNSFFE